jgi:isoleucyl-tRNA synthetase
MSVHLQSFPANERFFDYLENIDIRGFAGAKLLLAMDKVRSICNAALAIRNNAQIRIRQPLKKLSIICKEYSQDNNSFLRIIQDNELLNAIKDEVNVKAVEIALEGWYSYANLVPKINFPLLAKRLPHKIKKINIQIRQNNWQQVKGDQVLVCNELLTKQECELVLEPKDKKNCFALSNSLILLDLNIDQDLRLEGIARDLIRFIQETRKQAGLQINNKINLVIVSDFDRLLSAAAKWSDDIKKSALVENIDINTNCKDHLTYEYEIENNKVTIGVKKV